MLLELATFLVVATFSKHELSASSSINYRLFTRFASISEILGCLITYFTLKKWKPLPALPFVGNDCWNCPFTLSPGMEELCDTPVVPRHFMFTFSHTHSGAANLAFNGDQNQQPLQVTLCLLFHVWSPNWLQGDNICNICLCSLVEEFRQFSLLVLGLQTSDPAKPKDSGMWDKNSLSGSLEIIIRKTRHTSIFWFYVLEYDILAIDSATGKISFTNILLSHA